ncbi:LexA family protein [Kiloniella sp. b19]|uniref:LexA family protein n=1 Tax=Kiloniella sp. GXU_MW_B19 TaxID=3141326 RepID=UPI0031D4202A
MSSLLVVSEGSVPAGFPSPSDDYLETRLDLNQHLVAHPHATFLLRASGESMMGAGIMPGGLLVVDRSVEARHGHVVVAVVDGQFTVKRLWRKPCLRQPQWPQGDIRTALRKGVDLDGLASDAFDPDGGEERGASLAEEIRLMPENSNFDPIEISDATALEIWGVVTYVINDLSR